MKRITTIALGLLAFSASATALAQDKKIQLSLRTGYMIPMGAIQGSKTTTVAGVSFSQPESKLGDNVSGGIPLWLDAGYFVTPNILVGLYAQYAFISVKDYDAAKGTGCPTGADCSASDLRIGLQGQYHLSPMESLDPWFGLGVGYEAASVTAKAGGQEFSSSYTGLEFLNLQGGADFKVADGFGVGPFVSFSLGQYSSAKVESGGATISQDIDPKAMHEWLTLGVKGSLGL